MICPNLQSHISHICHNVVTSSQVTNKKRSISSTIRPITTEFGKVVTKGDNLLSIKSYGTFFVHKPYGQQTFKCKGSR